MSAIALEHKGAEVFCTGQGREGWGGLGGEGREERGVEGYEGVGGENVVEVEVKVRTVCRSA